MATGAKYQYVNYVQTYAVDFENQPKSGLYIVKIDADTKALLKDAKFHIYMNSTLIGSFTTNADGAFTVPNLEPGWYTVTEYAAPQGYVLDDTPKSVQVIAETLHKLEFENRKLTSLQVMKTDEYSGEPLSGAKFRVTTQNGEFVADVTTDANGKATVPSLLPGWYVVSETKAPSGYIVTEAARTVEVKATVPTVVTVTNRAENNLEIVKLDAHTRAPLSGAAFRVEHASGANVGTYNTDSAGKILVGGLKEGAYVISEIKAPEGYQLDSEPQTIVIQGGKLQSAEFLDKPLSGIQIMKTDIHTHAPLANATFIVERGNGERIGTYKTDAAGKVIVSGLGSGTYIVSETVAPEGYMLDAAPQTVVVKNNALTVAEFADKPFSGIEIIKTAADGTTPLLGAVFTIEKVNGERVGKYTTDVSGKIVVNGLAEGVYIVAETQAPDGYLLTSTPQTVEVKSGKLTVAEFTNKELPNLYIRKVDRETGELVAGAEFLVEKSGVFVAYVVSSASGAVIVPHVQPGVYTITEVKAPAGYELNDPVQTIEVMAADEAYYNSAALAGNLVTFGNNPLCSLEIVKLDSVTKNPLSGAMFDVTKANGEKIGSYRTDASGKILIPDITEGTYVVSETAAPDGYILSAAPQNVNVGGGKLVSVEFLNKPLSGIEIIKTDSVTHAPLSGATFSVARADGENIGTYKTDVSGKAVVTDLTEGAYIVSETIAPDGYILDAAPQTVTVKSGKLASAEFVNKPLAGLQIKKIDANTRQPIAGVSFEVSKMNGEKIGEFTTDKAGLIFVSSLEPGYYTVTETKAAGGYILDSEPRSVEITYGKSATLTVENTAMSGLLIVKTDEATRKPLAGVKFEVKKPNGEQLGIFTTDISGQIRLTDVPAGTLIVTETQALDGYEIDTAAREVKIFEGKQTTLEVTNKAKAGLRIKKIDSVTKLGIYGVEFMIFDGNNKQVGTYITDNNGVIDFAGILTEGRYTLRETRPAEGYYRDDTPRTVEFVSGKVTEVIWENTPQMGQIQITKLAGDDNEQNGLPKGSPLAGAVFEVYAYKSGNLLDRFVSGTDGHAVSKPLPLGRYIVKEVQAPQWYRLSAEAMDIEIEFATQVIKREFLNYSANTGVKIRKTGPYEAMPGDTIRYDVKEMSNTSSVPLTDFYWRDVLPTDAVRLNKIVTGTYNQSLKYKVMIATNKGDTRVVADNLSTAQNNVIDCRGAALGLASDEYVTSFTLIFGTVKAGFCKVETPQIYVTVNTNLPNGYEFGNKTDVGGKHGSDKYGSEWIVGGGSWVVKIYAPPKRLPRTGY
jgi:uncharacterized surface anchored protein